MATLQELAAERGASVTQAGSEVEPVAQRDVEPLDAFRRPLGFPWWMSRVEAGIIGALKHSSSALASAGTAVIFGAIGLTLVALFASSQWNAHVLQDRCVVVHATVIDVPGLVTVAWPEIAPSRCRWRPANTRPRCIRSARP